jgi:alkylation response protein AidB-like acyl-CoA dehydrogenase
MTAVDQGPVATSTSPRSTELSAGLVDRVRSIGPIIASGVAHANAERELAPEVVQALAGAQLFSMTAPVRHGGLGADVQTLSTVIQEIAQYDGSAAWVVMITNGGNFYTSRFPTAAQDDVFGANPAARVASVTSMDCTFTPVDGGIVLSGRFPFSSGIMHDDWAILGNATQQALVPRDQFRVERTWDTVGMRGTGSHTTVVEDVFVPEHRVIEFTKLMGYGACTDPDVPAELRLAPFEGSAVIIASVVVGLGRAMCSLLTDLAGRRMIPMTPYPKAADSPVFRAVLGEGMMRMESARLHLAEAARVLDAAAIAAEMPADDVLFRLRSTISHSVRIVTSALDDLMYMGGASGFASSSPLQQVWRDANVGARHVVTNAFVNYEWLGAAAVDPTVAAFKP